MKKFSAPRRRILITFVSAGVKRSPVNALEGIRDMAVELSKLDSRSVKAYNVGLCRQRLIASAIVIHQLGVKDFSNNVEIRWQIGRTLDRLDHPNMALLHIRFVCQFADEKDLRSKAFARNAEINLELFFQHNEHCRAGPAFEAASMADHIERSRYTRTLLREAEERLYESWKFIYGPLICPAVCE